MKTKGGETCLKFSLHDNNLVSDQSSKKPDVSVQMNTMPSVSSPRPNAVLPTQKHVVPAHHPQFRAKSDNKTNES
ncbi:hypothetical protein Mapa_018529 [Marchantia paleacea]|nr:hypothetical protein Mapa_018529 [Marchantia paleacea]